MKKAFYQFDTIFNSESNETFEKLGIYDESNGYVEGKIYIDINQIETINEADKKGWLTIFLHSGYSCMIKWDINKLLKLINNNQ